MLYGCCGSYSGLSSRTMASLGADSSIDFGHIMFDIYRNEYWSALLFVAIFPVTAFQELYST